MGGPNSITHLSLPCHAAYHTTSTDVGRSPPEIPHSMEEPHDKVDDFTENGRVVVSALNKIATLLRMLVEGYELTNVILVDQVGSVT